MVEERHITYEHRTVVSNVLVIGSGAAGSRAAIAAHEAGGDVVIVGKRTPPGCSYRPRRRGTYTTVVTQFLTSR